MAGCLHKHESLTGGQVQERRSLWCYFQAFWKLWVLGPQLPVLMGRTSYPTLHFSFNGPVTNKGVWPLFKTLNLSAGRCE